MPMLIEKEVVRNLRAININLPTKFYRLVNSIEKIEIIYVDIPHNLVKKYYRLKLKEEDSIIGAFVEWIEAKYLVSDNRHFLDNTKIREFEVISPQRFREMMK